jgi:hypothetical protein
VELFVVITASCCKMKAECEGCDEEEEEKDERNLKF